MKILEIHLTRCVRGQESISQSNIRRTDQIMSIVTDLETSQHQLKESSWAVQQATQELTRSSRATELEINGHFDELECAIKQRREWMLQQLASERAAKTAKLAEQASILIILTGKDPDYSHCLVLIVNAHYLISHAPQAHYSHASHVHYYLVSLSPKLLWCSPAE